MASYEISKDELYLAVAAKNQNIVCLNLMKQIYTKDVDNGLLDGSFFGGNTSLAIDQTSSEEFKYEVVA